MRCIARGGSGPAGFPPMLGMKREAEMLGNSPERIDIMPSFGFAETVPRDGM
jgi:hypothetical protein